MSAAQLVRGAAKLVFLPFALIFLLSSCSRDTLVSAASAESREHENGPHMLEATRRERFQASRHGFQYGVPKQAFSRAVSSMRTMERAKIARSNSASSAASIGVGAASSAAAILTGQWDFLGPQPIMEKANFTGVAVGSKVAMTGRMTSVAADSRGLIVAGAASGGLWLSTDNGAHFASVFDSQPTQAIGAIALDTTTNPSTIYVGTGEGNNSIDSLYGAGIYKSTDLGQHWDPLGQTVRSIG